MPATSSSRKPLLSISLTNSRNDYLNASLSVQTGGQFSPSPASLTLPTPLFIPSTSIIHTTQAPYSSPPYTPPDLVPSMLCDLGAKSFPCTPTTPLFSPIPDRNTSDPFDGSYPFPLDFIIDNNESKSSNDELHVPRMHIVPAQPLSPMPPKMEQMTHGQRLTGFISGHNLKSHLIRTTQANLHTPAAPKPRVTNCDVYSSHLPPRHILDVKFVRQYLPGAEIGVGAFGFVVTATHRLLGREVAVKFIERAKVPPWGWSMDLELGHIPTEIMLLKTLNHPGIIKFLDFFQDEIYFYLVQELHGSPWRGKASAGPGDTNVAGLDYIASISERSEKNVASPAIGSGYRPNQYIRPQGWDSVTAMDSRQTEQSVFPASSSSNSSLSLMSHPTSPHMTPRTTMARRCSHDLFECIEEHKRLSEPQARHIFAQVVDVIHYLHSAGVTHRDIKDENILIDRAFRVKVIDFGSASCVKPCNQGQRPWYRQYRGTIAYAPAEIFRGAKVHQAEPADVWALGILLSCLISGRRPFATAGDAVEGRVSLHRCEVREDGQSLSACQETNSVSGKCWDLLKTCLDPDPQTRATISAVRSHPWLTDSLETAL